MPENFTTKEILAELMKEVKSISDNQLTHIAYTKSKLEAIETQALKTNGRVTKLEDQVDTIENKQENLAAKVGTGVFLASSLFVYLLNKIL